MKAPDNLLFYSVNSFLSFRINSLFYKHEHFVWCSPVYDPDVLDALHRWKSIPPTSSPFHLYEEYFQGVKKNDLHCSKIRENKAGILKGATEKLKASVIDLDDYSRITQLVEHSLTQDYRPLLYLIPKKIVEAKVKLVKVGAAASPMSEEYQILDLKEGEFEVIEPRKV